MSEATTETDARPARPRRGDELELRIDSLAQGGRGVARTEGGFVIFVAGGLPGDRIRARVGKSKRSWAEATTVELLESAPERIADTCIHGDEPCPGAAWQGLPYELQLAAKQEQVAEALERIGGFDGDRRVEVEPIVPAVEQWRYRNKLEYSFGADTALDAPALGFHARGRWDEVVDVDDCHLASEANNAARNAIREWAATSGLPAYDRRRIRRRRPPQPDRPRGPATPARCRPASSPPRPRSPSRPTDLHTVVGERAGGTDGPTGVLGEEFLRERLGDLDLRVSPFAFLQTNTETAERLYAAAREFAGLSSTERLFDLYCGIGTIGLTLAPDAGEVWGIESVADAIVDAEANAELNGITNARFAAGDARLGIRPLVEEAGKPDVVVIDPPRAGLSGEDRPPRPRVRGEAHRLRLLQPHDDGPERAPDGRRRL